MARQDSPDSTDPALSTDPTINVRGAFGGGGNSQGTIIGQENHYEVQNYTSVIHGNFWTIRVTR